MWSSRVMSSLSILVDKYERVSRMGGFIGRLEKTPRWSLSIRTSPNQIPTTSLNIYFISIVSRFHNFRGNVRGNSSCQCSGTTNTSMPTSRPRLAASTTLFAFHATRATCKFTCISTSWQPRVSQTRISPNGLQMREELPLPYSRRLTKASYRCIACRQSKIKCSGVEPCANCQRRAIGCQFADASKIVVDERFVASGGLGLIPARPGIITDCLDTSRNYSTKQQKVGRFCPSKFRRCSCSLHLEQSDLLRWPLGL